MNTALFGVVFTIASTVSIGVLMVVAFVTGYDSMLYILGAIGVGFVLSLPISALVAKRLSALSNTPTAVQKTPTNS